MPGYLGDGYGRFSFCHVDDVVFGHLAAIEVGKEGERYLLCGENASFHNVMDMAASFTHTPAPKFDIPLWVLRISGHVCLAWARFSAWTGISHQVPFITPHVRYHLCHMFTGWGTGPLFSFATMMMILV